MATRRAVVAARGGIRRDITIEEMVERVPESVGYLMGKGIRAVMCGQPVWGTLEAAARAKGYGDAEIEVMVRELAGLP